jgi:nitroreductase
MYSATMLNEVYDITAYLCGARLHYMIRLSRLKCDYKYVFTEYYKMSRYPNGSMAVLDGLPAEYLLFRQHSEGLYFAWVGNFNFIRIIQAIFMQSLSTDVLI